MNTALVYSLLSVAAVSALAVLTALPLFIKKEVSKRLQLFLLSLSVGALLAVAFFDFIPEMIEEGYTLTTGFLIILGVLSFYVIERLIHYHHHGKYENSASAHSHAYHVGPVNLIGDAIHNFLDGIVIASAYLVNAAFGLSVTISVLFHELPQELADMGILLYAGYSKRKALLLNMLSALSSVLGVVAVFVLYETLESFHAFIIPFAAGNFIYIAAANLMPQLHRHCNLKDTIEHMFAAGLGVLIVYMISLLGAH